MVNTEGNVRVGDRFSPLPDAPRYGPKKWVLTPLRPQDIRDGVKRLWVEHEMTALDWLEHDLGPDSDMFESTAPITQKDIDEHGMAQELLHGRAIFPVPFFYPPGKGKEVTAQRLKADGIWESHYRDMEAKQKTIRLEPKPEVNLLEEIAKKKIKLERSD